MMAWIAGSLSNFWSMPLYRFGATKTLNQRINQRTARSMNGYLLGKTAIPVQLTIVKTFRAVTKEKKKTALLW